MLDADAGLHADPKPVALVAVDFSPKEKYAATSDENPGHPMLSEMSSAVIAVLANFSCVILPSKPWPMTSGCSYGFGFASFGSLNASDALSIPSK